MIGKQIWEHHLGYMCLGTDANHHTSRIFVIFEVTFVSDDKVNLFIQWNRKLKENLELHVT